MSVDVKEDLIALNKDITWLQLAYSNARVGHANSVEEFQALHPETLTGSFYFNSRADAVLYYRPYGGDADDVDRKIAAGEIKIGKPDQAAMLNTEGRWMCYHPGLNDAQAKERWMRNWLSFLVGMESEAAAGWRLRTKLARALNKVAPEPIQYKVKLKEHLDKIWRVVWETDLPYRGCCPKQANEAEDEPTNVVVQHFCFKGHNFALAVIRQWNRPTDIFWGLTEAAPLHVLLWDGRVYAHVATKPEARRLIEEIAAK